MSQNRPGPSTQSTSAYTPSGAQAGATTQHGTSTIQGAIGGPGQKTETRGRQRLFKKGLFAKDLPGMMYGFGDDPRPAPDTVAVMEEILIDYITDVCHQASKHSSTSKIKVEDFKFALRHPRDSKQLNRVEELLFMQKEIERARGQTKDDIQAYAKELAEDENQGGTAG